MGRPPKKPEDVKAYQLHIPLTAAQHEIIKEAVGLTDQDKAEWARAILLAVAKQKVAKSKERKPDRG
jgi:hypothetical protein